MGPASHARQCAWQWPLQSESPSTDRQSVIKAHVRDSGKSWFSATKVIQLARRTSMDRRTNRRGLQNGAGVACATSMAVQMSRVGPPAGCGPRPALGCLTPAGRGRRGRRRRPPAGKASPAAPPEPGRPMPPAPRHLHPRGSAELPYWALLSI